MPHPQAVQHKAQLQLAHRWPGAGHTAWERVLCPLRCAVLQPQGAQCFHSSPLRPTCCVLQHMTAGRWANALAGGLLRHTSEACEVRGPVLSCRHAVSSRAGPTTQQHAQLVDSQRCCTTVVSIFFSIIPIRSPL